MGDRAPENPIPLGVNRSLLEDPAGNGRCAVGWPSQSFYLTRFLDPGDIQP